MILRIDRLQTELPPPSDPDPAGAAAVQELLGGSFGEMSTFMNYTFQSFNFRNRQGARPFFDLVSNIAAEEFGHVELVARRSTRCSPARRRPTTAAPARAHGGQGRAQPAALHRGRAGRAAAGLDGRPWNGNYVFSSGDLVEDLTHNFFLETGARNNKLKVYEMVEHPAARALTGYLLVRGGVHQVAYARALENLTGADLMKLFPSPRIPTEKIPESKVHIDRGEHLKLYRFSADDYQEIAAVFNGPHPERPDEQLVVVDGSPRAPRRTTCRRSRRSSLPTTRPRRSPRSRASCATRSRSSEDQQGDDQNREDQNQCRPHAERPERNASPPGLRAKDGGLQGEHGGPGFCRRLRVVEADSNRPHSRAADAGGRRALLRGLTAGALPRGAGLCAPGDRGLLGRRRRAVPHGTGQGGQGDRRLGGLRRELRRGAGRRRGGLDRLRTGCRRRPRRRSPPLGGLAGARHPRVSLAAGGVAGVHGCVALLFGRGACAQRGVAFRLDSLRLGDCRRARRDGGVTLAFELLQPVCALELGSGHGRPGGRQLVPEVGGRLPLGAQPPLKLFDAVGVGAPQPLELRAEVLGSLPSGDQLELELAARPARRPGLGGAGGCGIRRSHREPALGRRQLHRQVRAHRQLGREQLERLPLPAERGDPLFPVVRRPWLVLEQSQEPPVPVVDLDVKRRTQEAMPAEPEPATRDLEPVVPDPAETFDGKGHAGSGFRNRCH